MRVRLWGKERERKENFTLREYIYREMKENVYDEYIFNFGNIITT